MVLRPDKGQELLQLPDDYTVLDLETTGISFEKDSIIEIGAIKVRKQKPIQKFTTLIHTTTTLEPRIEDLTGIQSAMLSTAPSFLMIAQDLWDFIGTDIVVGHSIDFDVTFLYDYYQKWDGRSFTNSFVDTFPISKKLFPELLHHRLTDMANYYKFDSSRAHRALPDCRMNYQVFEAMKATVLKSYGTYDSFFSKWNQLDNKIRAASIIPNTTQLDTSHPFYQKKCVITGALAHFSRKEAMQKIANCGGLNMDKLNTHSDILIIGNAPYCDLVQGISNKQKKAERLIEEGYPLLVITEEEFYTLLE